MITPGLYRHFKGSYYRVRKHNVALDANASPRYVVIYESVPTGEDLAVSIYVRTKEDFQDVLEDGTKRFTLVKRDACDNHLMTEYSNRCMVCGKDV